MSLLTLQMRAVTLAEDASMNLSDMPVPVLPERGALIRVLGCGLCGSDLEKMASGRVPAGTVLGHEVVGVIDALAPGAPDLFSVGQRVVVAHHVPCGVCVYCRQDAESMCRSFKRSNITPGGFAQCISVSEGHLTHTTFAVPEDITDAEAACVEPLACVMKAVRRLAGAESVAVIGLGFIGLLAAQLLPEAWGVDVTPERRDFAAAMGLRAFAPQTAPDGVDAVFMTVVTPAAWETALRLVRDGGKILIFAAGQAPVDASALYYRELQVLSSYSPGLQDLRDAAQAVFQRRVNVRDLVTHTLPLADIDQAVSLARNGEAIKVLLTP
jgi:L-iditol 2-dehydrogenase